MASQHGGDEARRQLAVVLLALFFLLVQFPVVVTTLTHGGPNAFDYQFPLFPSDIVLVPLLVLTAPDIVRRVRDRTLPAGTAVASEKKCLLGLADEIGFDLGLDVRAVQHYTVLQYVPEPETLHRGVRRLESGSYAIIRPGEQPQVSGRDARHGGARSPTG